MAGVLEPEDEVFDVRGGADIGPDEVGAAGEAGVEGVGVARGALIRLCFWVRKRERVESAVATVLAAAVVILVVILALTPAWCATTTECLLTPSLLPLVLGRDRGTPHDQR